MKETLYGVALWAMKPAQGHTVTGDEQGLILELVPISEGMSGLRSEYDSAIAFVLAPDAESAEEAGLEHAQERWPMREGWMLHNAVADAAPPEYVLQAAASISGGEDAGAVM